MLYSLVRVIMRVTLRLFYKRIFVAGTEGIPHTGSLIFVCNHPSSMMDAAILGVLLDRKIHFFTRGDIFSNPVTAKILSALHMIPVFHHDAGKQTINHNDPAFAKAENILRSGGAIVFFSEGISHTDRRLLPLKKGAFRLALNMMYENPDVEILLIPAGLNYAHPTKSNTEVTVNFSSPISLQKYAGEYQQRPTTAVLALSRHCYSILRNIVLHIDRKENDILAHLCLAINRTHYTFFSRGFLQGTSKKFNEEKKICDRINISDAEELETLKHSVTKYFNRLKAYQLTDEAVARTTNFAAWKQTFLYLCLPVVVTGYILNALPLLIANRITNQKVTRPDFYSWVLVVSSALLYLVWLSVLFVGFAINGVAVAFTVILLTVSTGAFAARYIPEFSKYRAIQRALAFKNENADLFNQLIAERTALSNHIAAWRLTGVDGLKFEV
jgi:1-acyl-sn-glycerol-3-phosphate acyltransferase